MADRLNPELDPTNHAHIPRLALAYCLRLTEGFLDATFDRTPWRKLPAPVVAEWAAQEIIFRDTCDLYESWGVEEPPEAWGGMPFWDDFGWRDGLFCEQEVYHDREDWFDGWEPGDDESAMDELSHLIEKAFTVGAKALEEFKRGELPFASWALSCVVAAIKVRAYLEVKKPEIAAVYAYRLGRIMTKHELHWFEMSYLKQKTDQQAGGRAKRTRQDIAEKVIQKVLELRSASNKSDTAIYAEVAKEPGLPKLSTIRRIMLEYASRK